VRGADVELGVANRRREVGATAEMFPLVFSHPLVDRRTFPLTGLFFEVDRHPLT
jgi:hypothetical protein